MTDAALRHQAHTLIDAITPAQLTAIVGLLQVIAPAPRPEAIEFEDEMVSDRENAQAAASITSQETPVPFEEILEEYGLSLDELLEGKSEPLVRPAA